MARTMIPPQGEARSRDGARRAGASTAKVAPDFFSGYGDLLPQLNRAVQRATIYPPGHPSVEVAVQPAVDTLAALLEKVESLSVLVSRQQLVAVGAGSAPCAYQLPWLSSRLAGRGVASITVTRPLTLPEGLSLAVWLSRPPGDDEATLDVDGVDVSWRDYGRTRFTEAQGRREPVDALSLWQDTVHGLVADWLASGAADMLPEDLSIDALVEDPAALAQVVRNTLLANEGTGLSAVAERLVGLGARLAEFDEPGRSLVRRRLGRLVGELAPELRGQLLRVMPSDSPEKLRMLSEVVDELPRGVVLDVIEQVEVGADRTSSSFVALLGRLATLSRPHPDLQGALGRAFSKAGLSPDLVKQDEGHLREALEQLLVQPIDDASVSDDYRRELDSLGAMRSAAPALVADARFLLPTRPEDVAGQLPRIAVALVEQDASRDDVAQLVKCAFDAAPRALSSRDVDFLAALARATRHIAEGSPGPEAATAARHVRQFLEHPAVADLVLGNVADAGCDPSPGVVDLFLAAGPAAADAVLGRLGLPPPAIVRDRLIDLVVRLDAEVLRGAIVRTRDEVRLPARTVGALLEHPMLDARASFSELFLADEDGDVRLVAYRIAFSAELSPTTLDRLARRALEDAEARIVTLAASEAQARHPTLAARVIGRFLAKTSRALDPSGQCQAADVLVAAGTPQACGALAEALARRGLACHRPARWVSRRIATALDRVGGSVGRAAARRWRRSPAGLVSLLLGDREASQ